MVSSSNSYFSTDSMVHRIDGEKHVSAPSGLRHLMLQSMRGRGFGPIKELSVGFRSIATQPPRSALQLQRLLLVGEKC
jgi:hypothetical protein